MGANSSLILTVKEDLKINADDTSVSFEFIGGVAKPSRVYRANRGGGPNQACILQVRFSGGEELTIEKGTTFEFLPNRLGEKYSSSGNLHIGEDKNRDYFITRLLLMGRSYNFIEANGSVETPSNTVFKRILLNCTSVRKNTDILTLKHLREIFGNTAEVDVTF